MARSSSNTALESKLQQRAANAAGGGNAPAAQGANLKSLLNSPAIKKRFEEMLDKRAAQYMTSIVNLYNSEKMLQQADPMSVITSCIVAATLDLPVDKNLGYAWIVPYAGKAQFQLGYKGYIQLALRTGQYKAINVLSVYEGELSKWNPLTEELNLDFEKRKSDAIIGYAGYFELVNGFRKTVYWTKDQIEAHRKKFSKSDFGWKKDYDAMALKTVIRNMLSKWGILSVEMQRAYTEEIEPIDDAALPSKDGASPIDLNPEDYKVGEESANGEGTGEEHINQNEMDFEE